MHFFLTDEALDVQQELYVYFGIIPTLPFQALGK